MDKHINVHVHIKFASNFKSDKVLCTLKGSLCFFCSLIEGDMVKHFPHLIEVDNVAPASGTLGGTQSA